MVERITDEGKELAIIIRNDHHESGVHFLTDDKYSQQLAYMHHFTGKIIDAHVHNFEERSVLLTQEVLVIKRGIIRVDFYKDDRTYLKSILLYAGDIILLASGGHGFEVIDEIEMIEIKQGPYLGDRDKIRFESVDSEQIKII